MAVKPMTKDRIDYLFLRAKGLYNFLSATEEKAVLEYQVDQINAELLRCRMECCFVRLAIIAKKSASSVGLSAKLWLFDSIRHVIMTTLKEIAEDRKVKKQ